MPRTDSHKSTPYPSAAATSSSKSGEKTKNRTKHKASRSPEASSEGPPATSLSGQFSAAELAAASTETIEKRINELTFKFERAEKYLAEVEHERNEYLSKLGGVFRDVADIADKLEDMEYENDDLRNDKVELQQELIGSRNRLRLLKRGIKQVVQHEGRGLAEIRTMIVYLLEACPSEDEGGENNHDDDDEGMGDL